MRWALRATTLDQHHVGSHRADHGPKHEPGEDLGRKGHKLTAIREPAPNLVKQERQRTLPLSPNSGRHIAIDRDGPVTEVLTLIRVSLK
jgi:hypothetical protein